MQESTSDKRRLAKNTLVLYVRTFVMMLISLFTSRIILDSLGVDNYGIYNIVGGFVGMFSLISGTLTASTQRFLTVELGKQTNAEPRKIFNASITIHIALFIIIFILLETFGLWFLNNQLNIPSNRLAAANWVFQCSVLTFLMGLINAPYTATIIAHEKMGVFAYFSFIDVFIKLLIVYALYITPYDRLIVYALLLLATMVLINFIYWLYCRRNFQETQLELVTDLTIYKDITGFATLNFSGAAASILSTQGINVLLNLFFGVTVNAARGITSQVQNAVMKFVYDFSTAINPQITKTYSSGEHQESLNLAYYGAKFAFFLTLMFTVPIFFKAPLVLDLWLKNYPEYTVSFVRLIFIYNLLCVLSNPIITVNLATGKLKKTTIYIGGTRLLILPLCWLVLKMGGSPESAYYVTIGMELLSLFLRLRIVQELTQISAIYEFSKYVMAKIIPVSLITFVSGYFISNVMPNTFIWLILFSICLEVIIILSIVYIGLTSKERKKVSDIVLSKLRCLAK